jgi:hypothetical protein
LILATHRFTRWVTLIPVTGIKNDFLLRSALLRASLRRKEKGFSFFTQHLRAGVGAKPRPRWRDMLDYFRPPLRGWFLVVWTIDSHF